MTELAHFARPASLRAIVRGLADRRQLARGRDRADARARRSGPVAGPLRRLGSSWRIVDDVPAGHRGRIDHLIVGPGGVFVVSGVYDALGTVCLGGDSLLVDGARLHHVRDSREDIAEVAERLSDAVGLPVSVTALVVVVGDRRFVVPSQPDDAFVRVTTPAAGVRWMRKRPVQWNHYGVERLHAAVSDASTWQPAAAPDAS